MAEVSFKDRVRTVIIREAKRYKENFVDYEYLLCSNAFEMKEYYIIDAKKDNFQHLTGVNSLVSPLEFFEKSYNGTLNICDFDFNKQGQSENAVIGSVRRKISVLPNMMDLFNGPIEVEENFVKNSISCSFATTDNKCTLGFINSSKARPRSLIKGNGLNNIKAKEVDLILRKLSNKEKFDELIIGNIEILKKYYPKIKNEIDGTIIEEMDIVQEQIATTTTFLIKD